MRNRLTISFLSRMLRFSLFLAIGFWVSGCATFPGSHLPVYTYADLPPAPEKKTCLVIPENCEKECRDSIDPVITMLEKSGYFQKAPEHCTADTTNMQNDLKFDFQYDFKFSNLLVGLASGFVCGATMTIIPGYGRDDYILKVQLKSGDKLVKEYTYREYIETWLHLFMLFMMPDHTPRTALRQMSDRMIMNFLYDYSHDLQQGTFASGD